MQLWDKMLEEHLLMTFQYDPLTGFVTRKHWGERGPRTGGPLGSVSSQHELLLPVLFSGRMYTIKLSKICVFLQTGKQYKKILWKDGVKTNNKFDNLVPIGVPINDDPNDVGSIMSEEECDRLHSERRVRLQQEADERAKKKEVDRLNKPAKPLDPVKAAIREERLKKIEKERIRQEGVDDFMKHHPDGIVHWEHEPEAPESEEEKFYRVRKEKWSVIVDKIIYDARFDIWRAGLRSKGTAADLQKFWKDCNELSGEVYTPSEFITHLVNLHSAEMEVINALPKGDFDRWYAAYGIKWYEAGEMNLAGLNSWARDYEYQGRKVDGAYSDLPPAWILILEEQKNLFSLSVTT